MSLTEQEMSHAALELVNCAMLEVFRSEVWRETKDERIVWKAVAEVAIRSKLPLAHLLHAASLSTRTELRPGNGVHDLHKAIAISDLDPATDNASPR